MCVCVRVGDGGDMWDDSFEFLFQSGLQFKSGRVLFHSSQHVPPLIALMPCWVSSSFSSLAEAANFITLKTYTALWGVVRNREKLKKKKKKKKDFTLALNESRVSAMATFTGRIFHSTMVCGKKNFNCLQVVLWEEMS